MYKQKLKQDLSWQDDCHGISSILFDTYRC